VSKARRTVTRTLTRAGRCLGGQRGLNGGRATRAAWPSTEGKRGKKGGSGTLSDRPDTGSASCANLGAPMRGRASLGPKSLAKDYADVSFVKIIQTN